MLVSIHVEICPKICLLELEQTSHLVRLCKFFNSGLFPGELKLALLIRKWFGVITPTLFISCDTWVSGLLYKIYSTSVRKVTNDFS